MEPKRGPFTVYVLRCDQPTHAEPDVSAELLSVWKAIDGHWDKDSRKLVGFPTQKGWRLWARPNYESAFWRAVDFLEGEVTFDTLSGSWLVKDTTGLMTVGLMTWSSTHHPPAQSPDEQRALDELRDLGSSAPEFMKVWARDRKRKPAMESHSPRNAISWDACT